MNSIYSLEDIDVIAREIIQRAHNHTLLFYGEMGTGKTTLIKAIVKALGVTHPTTSPTFALVNEYSGDSGKIYHFDFYRIDTPEEALDIGLEEYLESNAWVLIEWPEKVEKFLPENVTEIHIQKLEGNQRIIKIL
ncbi:tRNA (adenosine(37)-N6)-threonylcarbamoyltransferase complex ATPase subunit type 1 TsaE [Ascidiimonas aurantiaca]|uniref:tRNA (adenosine(37)-N6)-threonylcarbamoyltransferase complex ATPase subunit type 1 TsaE n=1 Tax=Ascidiimonas aurantiaca TaxID=1685432 RepID=UPI0030EF48E3